MGGHKVLFDRYLAPLYQVTNRNFNKAVQRNRKRFPDDFIFQLTQMRTRRAGIAMLSSVPPRPTSYRVNIGIVRTFVGSDNSSTHEELLGDRSSSNRARTNRSRRSSPS